MLSINLLFEELLDDVAWKIKIYNHIKNGYIPLTKKIIKLLINQHKRIISFHITDFNHLDSLINLVKQPKPISTFTFINKVYLLMLRGVQTKGGILVKISGSLDFMASFDLESKVDYSLKRRWIDSELLSNELHEFLINKYSNVNYSINTIKTYLTDIEKFIEKNTKKIEDKKRDLMLKKSGDWNELIVRDIEILGGIYKLDDEESLSKEDEIVSKLKVISNNIIQVWTPDEITHWFKENGGFLSFDELKTNNLNNKFYL